MSRRSVTTITPYPVATSTRDMLVVSAGAVRIGTPLSGSTPVRIATNPKNRPCSTSSPEANGWSEACTATPSRGTLDDPSLANAIRGFASCRWSMSVSIALTSIPRDSKFRTR